MTKTDAAFDLIVEAALAGERCPISHKYKTTAGGPRVDSARLRDLASQGKIRIEVYPRNWRVVHILVGPHAGAATKAFSNPDAKPWLVTDAASIAAESAPGLPGGADQRPHTFRKLPRKIAL